ncbi:MAG: cytochrome c oxidase subunit II [Rhodothermales bacterium]|nr:cytochrome c oxidase subunit II [Rhodothermales bacterium]
MEPKGTLWLPPAESTLAPEIDSLFYFVYWISVIIFALVVLAMLIFVVKYRRRKADEMPPHVEENKLMELSWIVVPTILCLIVFTWGFQSFLRLSTAPPDSYEITVRAKKWLWEFEYPNGTRATNELRVPVGRNVRLVMSSEDVLHSFFVPAFRVKHDVLPNRYTAVWFNATTEGEKHIFCTEYCGTQHSGMLAKVIVLPQEEFTEWVESGGGNFDEMPLPEYGATLYQQQACFTCHSIDGTQVIAPSFKGLYGSQRTFEDGSTATADDNYIRESILNPMAHIVQGFSPIMPASYSSLDERQVSALIEFIELQQ